MRTTRLVLLASLLVAMIFAAGQALAGIPNVELVTMLAFVAGYLLGPALGAAVGAAGMGAHSLFNVLGSVVPPLWIAQVLCFALIGAAGGIIGPRLARATGRVRAAILSALTGTVIVLFYQLVVNVVAFYTFTSDVDVWVYVWGGIAFAAVHIAWIAAVFALAIPPTLRVLASQRRVLRQKEHGPDREMPR